MFNHLLGFRDEEERNEFLIALPVLGFFGCMLYYFVFGGDQWVSSQWQNYQAVTAGAIELTGDVDADGVPDAEDHCTVQAGPPDRFGCPVDSIQQPATEQDQESNPGYSIAADTDGDGISDQVDECPAIAGEPGKQGCPDATESQEDPVVSTDRDGDGVADEDDQCPDSAGLEAEAGCPAAVPRDTDGDGVPDDQDVCPQSAGAASNKGCPADSDADGLPDDQDRCPGLAGPSDTQGCPDRDADGVTDEQDRCSNIAGVPQNQGCPPDADRDGIADQDDKCPTEVGLLKYQGCIAEEIASDDTDVIQGIGANITFEPASAVLTQESKTLLQAVVRVLEKYSAVKILVEGHTDSQGEAAINQKLSEQRARACVTFMNSAGIASERMSSRGFGETKPVAGNDTAQGRRLNRRVEFKVSN